MNRSQPMRQYANQSQSGTITGGFRKDPMDNIVDRVMMIAQRVVAAENQVKRLTDYTKTQDEKIAALEKKIENLILKANGQEFKKPETKKPARRKSAAKVVEEVEEPTSLLDEGVEV